MGRFVVLYNAPASAREQMASATPEQAQAGMQAWMTWAGEAGSAIVDLGAPLQPVARIADSGASSDSGSETSGYSVLQADDRAALEALLEKHPHLTMPGASIEVLEVLPIPGT
jgi:hypothetical protein